MQCCASWPVPARMRRVVLWRLQRFAFNEEAKECFAIVQCGAEYRPFANFILRKGAVGPDGKDLRP